MTLFHARRRWRQNQDEYIKAGLARADRGLNADFIETQGTP
jgi:hypothetical protein